MERRGLLTKRELCLVLAFSCVALLALGLGWIAGRKTSSEVGDESTADKTMPASVVVIDGVAYHVNNRGQSYGSIAAPLASVDDSKLGDPGFKEELLAKLPDLVSVLMPDDEVAYLTKEDFYRCSYEEPAKSTPEDALKWMEEGQPMTSAPLYAEDGETQVGTWVSSEGAFEAQYLD